MCELVVTRIGLYGSVLVRWSSGYSALRAPENVEQGRTLPQSGELFMANLQKSANISLKVSVNYVCNIETLIVYFSKTAAANKGKNLNAPVLVYETVL